MSASEKLRAKMAEAFPIPRHFTEEEQAAQRALSAALPQIMAVVEAAEAHDVYGDLDAQAEKMCAALAALDEALSSRGSTDTIGTR